jgi:hypothetical protein
MSEGVHEGGGGRREEREEREEKEKNSRARTSVVYWIDWNQIYGIVESRKNECVNNEGVIKSREVKHGGGKVWRENLQSNQIGESENQSQKLRGAEWNPTKADGRGIMSSRIWWHFFSFLFSFLPFFLFFFFFLF